MLKEPGANIRQKSKLSAEGCKNTFLKIRVPGKTDLWEEHGRLKVLVWEARLGKSRRFQSQEIVLTIGLRQKAPLLHFLSCSELFWGCPPAMLLLWSKEYTMLREHTHLKPALNFPNSAEMTLRLLLGPEQALSLSIVSVTNSISCMGTMRLQGSQLWGKKEDVQNLDLSIILTDVHTRPPQGTE